MQGQLEIVAPGFVPERRDVPWPLTGAATQNVGVISLMRAPQ